MTDTNDDFSGWIGRSESVDEALGVPTAQAAAAMLDLDPDPFRDGAELPPLWHWFYFLSKTPQSQLGEDGHPARRENSFMPPIPLPRRMFAGARLRWHAPMALGRTVRRETVIHSIERKTGRSGDLAFVTVACRFTQDGALCLEEEQDIVYRGPGQPVAAVEQVVLSPPPATSWSQRVVPDTRLLFRFSALTFNAHRIHYDRPYAMNEEKYPGLVVHGPLTAILLLHLVRNNSSRPVAEFQFRSKGPLFDLAPFRLLGIPSENHITLEAQGPDGKTAMEATARLA